ncbi:hypothetical protein [Olleya sp. HaHaR_3_96]|uniref:hypothetical protein n=1 Tax=Olleya sp. HaHaR_3_96 TaxID=2745560 RepID=UPI001C4F5826|nr:hypothetical protein [Olleya sp. HaHaR_3_96]QXP59338.1 hypothetical protein H0I26_15640 [Olleya sp. HaHaR_3_96]
MSNKKEINLITQIGFGMFFLFFGLIVLFILLSIFSSTLNFKSTFVFYLIPLVLYFFYLFFFVKEYYKNLALKKASSLKEFKLKIDRIITDQVIEKKFTFYGQGAQLNEYYFTFFNNELSKNITVSTIQHKPPYFNLNLNTWKNSYIIIYLDEACLNKIDYKFNEKSKMSSIKSYRFIKSPYNLEDRYLYNFIEDISNKNLIQGLWLVFVPIFIVLYSIYYISKNFY